MWSALAASHAATGQHMAMAVACCRHTATIPAHQFTATAVYSTGYLPEEELQLGHLQLTAKLPTATTNNPADTGAAVTDHYVAQQTGHDLVPFLLNSSSSTATEMGSSSLTTNSSDGTQPAGPLTLMAVASATSSRQNHHNRQERSDSQDAQDSHRGYWQRPRQYSSSDQQEHGRRHGSGRGDRHGYGYDYGSSSGARHGDYYGGSGGSDYRHHHGGSSSGGWPSGPGSNSPGQQHGGGLSCTACQWPYQLLTAPTGVRYCGELFLQ